MQKASLPIQDNLYHYIVFAFLLIAALGLRLLALEALSDSIYYDSLLPDEQYYHTWAVNILNGKDSVKAFEYAPLPAYLIALIYKCFSIDIHLIRIANIILNVFGCLSIYYISKILTGRNWALLALALAACSTELVFYSVVPLKTSLAFFLFAFLIFFVLRSLHHISYLQLYVIGLILGLLMTVRPNVVILLPILIPAILFFNKNKEIRTKKILTTILIVAGFFCSSIPLSLHNYLSSKQFSLLPVQSGFLFYCTNTINNPSPQYRPVPFASSHPDEQGIHFVIEASKREGKRFDDIEASRYWQLQVVSEAIESPNLMLKKLWQKTLMLFNFSENGDHYNIGVVRSIIPFFNMLHLQYWWFIIFGYTGLLIGSERSSEIRCLSLIFLAYLLTLFLYSTGNRFMLPLLAILIPVGVWNCSSVFHLVKEKKYSLLTGTILSMIVLTLIGRIDVEGTGDVSNHYNNLAFFYNQKGESRTAVNYWQKSVALNQTYSDIARLFLVGPLYQIEGSEKAIEILHDIPDNSFMAAAKYATLGDIYKHHQAEHKAFSAYKKSISINGGQIRVRKEIIAILAKKDPDKVHDEITQLKWIESFHN